MNISFPSPHRRGLPAFWLFTLIGALLCSLPSGVRAANFVVNSTADDSAAIPGRLTLRQAIVASNASAGGNTIDVTGVTGTITLIQGELTISSDVTLTGPGANNLTVSGVAAGSGNFTLSRVFNIADSTTVAISGLTIANGDSSSADDNPGFGGGIFNGGSLTLTNCTILNNSASSNRNFAFCSGGGIYTNGSLTLSGCTVTGNSVNAEATSGGSDGEGGGTGDALSEGGGISASGGTLTCLNSTFSGNSASGSNSNGPTDFEGGGIYEADTLLTLTNCVIGGSGPNDANSAQLGGGVRIETRLLAKADPVKKSLLCGSVRPLIALAEPTLTGCTVQGNVASQGGGLYVTGPTQVSLLQDQIWGNQAFTSGGGVYDLSGNLLVDQTTFSGNIAGATLIQEGGFAEPGLAGYGGALYNEGSRETITNSTFSSNMATAGGGLFVSSAGSDHIGNSTFYDNTASGGDTSLAADFVGDGGAIANDGSNVFLTNCTVSRNTAVDGGGLYYNGTSMPPVEITGAVKAASLTACQTSLSINSSFTVTSSLVAGNTLAVEEGDAAGTDIFAENSNAPFATGGSNLIGDDDNAPDTRPSGFANGINHDQVGTAAAPINPQLGPLQNNGGPTQTQALLPGSPAIDNDFNGPSGQSLGDGVTQDQRGIARPQQVRNDIGAYEFAIPIAVNDTYSDPENTTLKIPAPGVLSNDTPATTGHTLAAVNGTQPAHGAVVLNSDGSFNYTPNANFVGTDTFTYQAQDTSAAPVQNSNPATVTITVNDTTPPATIASLAGTLGSSSFYRGPVTVTLTATDPDNTAAQITTIYTTDGSDPKNSPTAISVTGGPVTLTAISGDGAHTVTFFSKDPAGNTEMPVESVSFTIDTTPPHTTVTPSGTAGKNGFFVSPVSVTFAASDAVSGVASTTYTLDGGTPQTFTASALGVSADGLHTLTYASTDRAGNVEATGTVSFSIDTTPPVTTASFSGPQTAATAQGALRPQAAAAAYTGPVTVTLSPKDNFSGVAVTTYAIDNGPSQTYTQPFVVSAFGTHTLTFGSTDNAGNVETTQTQTFTINTAAKPQILHTFPTGLYLFSVPQDMTGIPLTKTFDQPGIKLAVWLPQILQYVLNPTPPSDALRPGQGYWARFGQATNLYDLGTPTPTNTPFAIPIHVGWNMIGNPFPSSAPSSSLRVQTSTGTFTLNDSVSKILLSPTFYSYDTPSGQYQAHALPTDALTPYIGYWLYSRCDGNLIVNTP